MPRHAKGLRSSSRFSLALLPCLLTSFCLSCLIGAALQEQWHRVGIQLELRPLELATLFSDVAKGNFQMTYQRWVGANTDPDFFEYAFSSKRFPPDGANRGHYRNARTDALTDQIRVEMNQ
jgi:peptide/nickel transport system substrate-binding protein